VLAFAAALAYLWFGILRGNPPVYAAPPPPPSLAFLPTDEMTVFTGPSVSFAMDRFAFPNRPGWPPTVGLSYNEAADWCAAAGKRLCTAGEWMIAAGGAQQSLFVNPRIDNREHPEFLECYPLKPPSQAPVAGARKGCRNESGVEDLIGGVWQWVATPGWPDNGFHLLKGAAYRYSDDLRAENSYQYWLHDSQFKLIDKSEIGFRCCADAPR
jgi:formylglycine-generating enzyme required for sulfatase activity